MTRTTVRDMIKMSKGGNDMKEMLKNKWMVGFMVLVLSLTYMNGTNERQMMEREQLNENTVVYSAN